jgi:hypothetical protein
LGGFLTLSGVVVTTGTIVIDRIGAEIVLLVVTNVVGRVAVCI